jgi:hypothetical protein
MHPSAITYRLAFYNLSLRDLNCKYCLTSGKWRMVETMSEILKPFYNITSLIFESSFPTLNLYFREIRKIECLVRAYLTSEDILIQNMV